MTATKSVDTTLPPWSPEIRLQAVRALATYCETVEACGRTSPTSDSRRAGKRDALKHAATEDLVNALAGVGLAVSFVAPVRPGPLNLGPKTIE